MKKNVSFTKDLQFPTMIGKITEITVEDNLKFIDSNNVEGSLFISGKYKMTEASRLEEDFSFNLPIEIAVLENCEPDTCKVSIANFNYEIIDDDILRSNIDILVEGREIIEDTQREIPEPEAVNLNISNFTDNIDEASVIEEISESKVTEEDEKERECDGDSKEKKEIEIPMKIEKTIPNAPTQEESKPTQEESIPTQTEPTTRTQNDVNYQDATTSTSNPINKTNTTKDSNINNTNSLFSNLTDEVDTFSTYSVSILREGDTLEKVMERYNISKEKLEEYNDLGTITLNSKIIIPNTNND